MQTPPSSGQLCVWQLVHREDTGMADDQQIERLPDGSSHGRTNPVASCHTFVAVESCGAWWWSATKRLTDTASNVAPSPRRAQLKSLRCASGNPAAGEPDTGLGCDRGGSPVVTSATNAVAGEIPTVKAGFALVDG